jgi:hypothetical protein
MCVCKITRRVAAVEALSANCQQQRTFQPYEQGNIDMMLTERVLNKIQSLKFPSFFAPWPPGLNTSPPWRSGYAYILPKVVACALPAKHVVNLEFEIG